MSASRACWTPVRETGAPYMVMEYLDGSDLSAWLRQHGRSSVEFVLQALEGSASAVS